MVPTCSRFTIETLNKHDGDQGLAVDDCSILNHLHHFRPMEVVYREHLVGLQGVVAWGEVVSQIEVDHLIGEAGSGPDLGQLLQPTAAVAGLLPELAVRRGIGMLTAVSPSCGNLPEKVAGGVTELSDQQDPRIATPGIVEEGQDGGGAGMPEHLQLADVAVRKLHRVDVEGDDATGVDSTRGE